MSKQTFLIWLTLLVLLIAATHVAAIAFYWYWYVPPLDTVVHFLGGAWVAGMTFWFLYSRRRFDGVAAFGIGLIASLVVGLLWEYFEYANGIIFVERSVYIRDTMTDLVADMAGGIAATYAILRLKILPTLESAPNKSSNE